MLQSLQQLSNGSECATINGSSTILEQKRRSTSWTVYTVYVYTAIHSGILCIVFNLSSFYLSLSLLEDGYALPFIVAGTVQLMAECLVLRKDTLLDSVANVIIFQHATTKKTANESLKTSVFPFFLYK